MRASSLLLSSLLLASGCSSVHSRSAEREESADAKVDAAPVLGRAPVAETSAPEPVAPLSEYRGPFLRELMRLAKAREATVPPGDVVRDEGAPVPYSVEVLKKVGQADGTVVATLGFGRVPHGRERARVELLAYVDQYGLKIGQVLAAVGRAMHAAGESAPSWKEYDTVKLEKPEHGMTYFDLRAAGEVDLGPDRRVILLKVIPMSEEEFEKSKKNVSAEWDDPNAAARAKARWARLLEPS